MSQEKPRLYIVRTVKGVPSMVVDTRLVLKDGKVVPVQAYMSKINKVYVQYQIDVSGLDKDIIFNISGKKAKFVAPSEKECSGQYMVGDWGLIVIVSFENVHVCDIPKYAVISIEDREFCGRFNMIEGYEVEYRICLPEGINPDDVLYAEQ